MTPTLLLLLACTGGPSGPAPSADSGAVETGDPPSTPLPAVVPLAVRVTLDGAPVHGATLAQGGNPARWTTDAQGEATVDVDTTVEGDLALMASHPEARIVAEFVDGALDEVAAGLQPEVVELALIRFDTTDNPAYTWQDPGEPDRNDTTAQCAHCHVTINADWFASPHAQAARNPKVQDLYAGVAAAFDDAAACADAGGRWWTGLEPGTGLPLDRCYIGDGVLPDLNADCGDTGPCDGVAEQTGQCADCHAPAGDGALGGHDLLGVTGFAYDYGVHCDLCHKVESVDLDATDPGVAGRLRILRPSEEGSVPGLDNAPITFGPYDDVPNPRMGSVARPFFRQAQLCAGCHQHDQPVLLPDATIDAARWPDGLLPVQSTYAEWLAGPYGSAPVDQGGDGGAPCQSCHMPADADVGNSADLGNVITAVDPGLAAGWWREPGAVRRHTWFGPRSEEQRMLDLAASVRLEAGDTPGEVHATVKNEGPGHALPTGEPLRQLLLVLSASCDGVPVDAVGGDAVPDTGGARDSKPPGEDWSVWPGAAVGDRIRVVQRTGAWHDYQGFGPFGDGRFSAEEKGLPVEEVVGSATVVAVDGDTVELDGVLPEGDRAFRVDGHGLPVEAEAARAWAGAPGFAFARVMVDDRGHRHVPHHRAVDVASDNRLLPRDSWTSSHRFPTCDAGLQVQAALVYRAAPLELAAERGWALDEQVIAAASLVLP